MFARLLSRLYKFPDLLQFRKLLSNSKCCGEKQRQIRGNGDREAALLDKVVRREHACLNSSS